MKRIPFSQVLKTAAIDIRREYTYESISSAKYVMVALALALQKCRLFFQR